MTRSDTEDLVVSLFEEYRPGVDTSEGSDFQTLFLQPLLDKVAVDDTTADAYVLDRLEQAFPDVDFRSRGGALGDLFRKAPSALLDGVLQNLRLLRLERAGLSDPSSLTTDSANDLAGNFFVSRVTAGYSLVAVRMYFSTPIRTVLFTENTARTADGLLFIPSTVTEISTDTMKRDGSLYYIDVLFVAQKPGTDYEIDAKTIFTVDGVPGLVKATNLAQSTRVNDDETTEALAQRVLDSITDRSQVIKRGIATAVTEAIPSVAQAQVIGFNDPEMHRDVLTADIEWLTSERPTQLVAAGGAAYPIPLFYSSPPYYAYFPFTNQVILGGSVEVVPAIGELTDDTLTILTPLPPDGNYGMQPVVVTRLFDGETFTSLVRFSTGPTTLVLTDDPGWAPGESVVVSLTSATMAEIVTFQKDPDKAAYLTFTDNLVLRDREITGTSEWTPMPGTTLPVQNLGDFFVGHAQDITTTHYAVDPGDGADLIQSPKAEWTGAPIYTSSLYLASPGDELFYWETLWSAGGEHAALAQYDTGTGLWLQSTFNVIAFGGSTAPTEATVASPYLGDPRIWVRVPGYLQLITAGGASPNLTLVRKTGSPPRWMEFSGAHGVLEAVQLPSDPGYTYMRLEDFPAYGFDEGSATLDTYGSIGYTVTAGDTYLWTYWVADTDRMFPPSPQRGTSLVLHATVLRASTDVDNFLTLDEPLSHRGWVLREETSSQMNYVISVSHAPGGILFPTVPITEDSPEGRLYCEPDSVHIGGKTDVYVALRTDYYNVGTQISETRDIAPTISGEDAQIGYYLVNSAEFTPSNLDDVVFKCATLAVYNEPSFVPHRLIAGAAGAVLLDYAATDYADPPAAPTSFYVSSPYLTYDLLNPRIVRTSGSDLETFVFSRVVRTSAPLDTVVPQSSADAGDVLRILTQGQNTGTYTIVGVNTTDNTLTLDREPPVATTDQSFEVCRTSASFPFPIMRCTDVQMADAGGSLSIPHGKPLGVMAHRDFVDGCGTLRVYFKDPTFFYARHAIFRSKGRDYVCPTKSTLYTSSSLFDDTYVVGGTSTLVMNNATSAQNSLLANAAFLGDVDVGGVIETGAHAQLRILYRPICLPYVSMATAKAGVVGLSLRLRVGVGGPMRTLVFTGANPLDFDAVGSPGGIIQQINTFFPGVTATTETNGGSVRIKLCSDQPVVVGNGTANALLGLTEGQDNTAVNAGRTFGISTLAPYPAWSPTAWGGGTEITVADGVLFADEGTTGIVFVIEDEGPIVFPSSMQLDLETGLYYAEVYVTPHPDQLVPDSPGTDLDAVRDDSFELLMDPYGGDDDGMIYFGYHLSSEEESLTFSLADNLKLKVSAWFFAPGATNILSDKLYPASQQLTVYCDYCPATSATQELLVNNDSRIVVADPLAKAAVPVWVLGAVIYSGGEDETTTLTALKDYVRTRSFGQYLDISGVRSVFERYGATDFADPTTLVMVKQDRGREFSMARLTDRFYPERTARLMPETLPSCKLRSVRSSL